MTPLSLSILAPLSLFLVGPLFANPGILFIDELYGTQRTNDIQYGTGSTGNPASGSIDLFLDLYQPTGASLPDKRPAFIFIHGGGFTAGDKEAPTISELCESYAKRGYVCASIQYRLVDDDPTYEPGPFVNLTDRFRAINAASQDAAKAVRWLRQNAATYNIDPSRIGIGGSSAGAITSLYTASQEATTIGPDAEVGVVLDLWGAMYGHEDLIDADAPAIFIVHGTDDRIVPYSQTENLTNHLESINHPYALYPIPGAAHGPWGQFNSDVVDGKTIFQLSVEFAFEHLNLIEIHPVSDPLNRQLDMTIDSGINELTLSFPSVCGFQYLVQSSEDLSLNNWTSETPASPLIGTDSPLFYSSPIGPSQKFYRIEVSPNF